jgi:spermidine synthase
LSKKIFYLNLIFWVGFTSLVYEIYSTKVLFLFFLESSQAVTIAITAFLAGLAFSSLIFSSFSKNSTKNNLKIIFFMQLAIIIYGYLILRQYNIIPHIIDFLKSNIDYPSLVNLIKTSIIWIYLFIPAFFIGGSFPLVNGLYLESVEKGTRSTGIVYFWDTLGAIFGGMLAGFVFLPYLGFRLTCVVAVLINLVIAFAIAPKKIWQIILIVAVLLIIFNEFWFYKSNSRQTNITSSTKNNHTTKTLAPEYPELDKYFGNVLFQEVSPYGRITIGDNAFGDTGNKVLFINYRDMCHSKSHESESIMGTLVADKSPGGSRILNVGFGCGFTAGAIASSNNVSKFDIAEINPVIPKASGVHFKTENGDVLNNPKTTLNIIDGAEYIRNTYNKYNAIVIDIEEVTIIYSSPLYTKEYFALAKNKLTPDGVLAVWAFRGTDSFEKVIYNTLKSIYKNVSLITIDGFFTFYASDSTKNLPLSITGGQPTESEQKTFNQLVGWTNQEINTLDNRTLDKYFSVKNTFNLPTNYSEKYLKD